MSPKRFVALVLALAGLQGALYAAERNAAPATASTYRIPITSESSPYIAAAEWSGGAYSTRIGIFNHIAGRGKGKFTFRVRRRESFPVRGVSVTARVSSDFPGCTAPPDGYSQVTCTVNSQALGSVTVVRDNSRGRATTWAAPVTSTVAFSGKWLTVTLSVPQGAEAANGLSIYSKVTSYGRCAVTPITEEEKIPLIVTLHHDRAPAPAANRDPSKDPDYINWAQHRKVVELVNPVDGSKQKVMICLPRDYTPRRPCALIVHHHSHGGKHSDIARMGLWHPLASSYNSILVSGDLHGNAWGNDVSMADIDQMVKYVKTHFAVDPTRIYGHGNSMGGAILTHMGRHPEMYAAGVVVHGVTDVARMHADNLKRPHKPFIKNIEKSMGGPPPRASYERASGISYAPRLIKVPMLFYHGEADKVVTPDHSMLMAEAIVRRGGKVRLVTVPQWGHACQIADELSFMKFLFQHRNTANAGRRSRVATPSSTGEDK